MEWVLYFFMCKAKWDLKILIFCPERPKWDQTSDIYISKQDDKHSRLFLQVYYMYVPFVSIILSHSARETNISSVNHLACCIQLEKLFVSRAVP